MLTPQTIARLQEGLGRDMNAFAPELIACGTIVVLLLLRLFTSLDRLHLGWVALSFSLVALVASCAQWVGGSVLLPPSAFPVAETSGRPEMFSGLLAYDNFTIFLRMFLYAFAALVIWLSMLTGIPDREDSGDFYVLLLGGTVGMALMASANHLLMVFIAIEMASLPSYALAGFLKGRRQSSEASLKYVVYGGGAAGVMLYGISLIAGKFGTGYLPDLAKAIPAVTATGVDPVLLLGMLFILVGLAFKLSAVPFHFWCPDVFEGAAAEVAGFLSVASKGAAMAIMARLLLVIVGPYNPANPGNLVLYLVPVLAFLAALTATFGNLAAFPQTNLKRLLAYSTIAHAGYMIMGLATLNSRGASAVLFYLVTYLFMNLGAFAIVAFLRNQTGSEDLSSFRGIVQRSPVLVITLTIFLLSLLGMPPLAGFMAKFQIFSALYDTGVEYNAAAAALRDAGDLAGAANATRMFYIMMALLVIGGLNSVVSLVYYVKVIKVMIIERPIEEVEGQPIEPLPLPQTVSFYATLMAAMIFIVGLAWNPLGKASDQGVLPFMATSEPRTEAQADKVVEAKP